jgi:cytochrome c-type biogenesis protein CcmE
MTRKQKRLTLIGSAVGVLALAVGIILYALRDNVVFFYGPAELVAKHVGPGTRLRIGGLVKDGTLVHLEGKSIKFQVTDGKADVPVAYTGLLPDLFKEGQGVVAEGALDKAGVFEADSILAKHDERYMPREVADALKKQGVWKEGGRAAEGARPVEPVAGTRTAAGAPK